MRIWKDITQDKAGRHVAKDVFKAVSFLVGTCLVVATTVGDFWGKEVGLQGGAMLLLLAFGIQVNKDWASLAHRQAGLNAGCEPVLEPELAGEQPEPASAPEAATRNEANAAAN